MTRELKAKFGKFLNSVSDEELDFMISDILTFSTGALAGMKAEKIMRESHKIKAVEERKKPEPEKTVDLTKEVRKGFAPPEGDRYNEKLKALIIEKENTLDAETMPLVDEKIGITRKLGESKPRAADDNPGSRREREPVQIKEVFVESKDRPSDRIDNFYKYEFISNEIKNLNLQQTKERLERAKKELDTDDDILYETFLLNQYEIEQCERHVKELEDPDYVNEYYNSFCPKCSSYLPEGSTSCGVCGTQLVKIINICPNCGRHLDHNANYCYACGRKMK